ncbi:MAG: hypothetical protein AAB787_02730 [Patescibacteria group bacterium]
MKIEKKSFLLIIFGIVVLGLIVFFAFKSENPEIKKDASGKFLTREVISRAYEVPEVDTVGLPENIAVPSLVLPLNPPPGNTKRLRVFNLSIEGDRFSPDTIIVNDWDEFSIYVTAIDKDYDFTQPDMGVSVKTSKGERVLIKQSFGETKGARFYFFCASCGGPLQGPRGQILTVPRPRPL